MFNPDIEKRAFNDLVKMLFGAKEIILGTECAFVAPFEEKDYICISKTYRMMIISYVKNKDIYKQKFIEIKEYTNDEI